VGFPIGRPGGGSKPKTMTSAYVRRSAVAAPALLLLYGVLRLIDGLDGHHGRGYLWNLGHTAFFLSFVLLAGLMIAIRAQIAGASPGQRPLATAAMVAALLGAAAFLWVILGDLFAALPDLPDALQLIGPLLFEIGALTLLGQLVVARPPRLPIWSPVLVFAGFLAIALMLDLLPFGALLIGAGLAPLARPALVPA
jgi:hypothetical protein